MGMEQLDQLDQQLLNEMQDRFPTVPAPFAELAQSAVATLIR